MYFPIAAAAVYFPVAAAVVGAAAADITSFISCTTWDVRRFGTRTRNRGGGGFTSKNARFYDLNAIGFGKKTDIDTWRVRFAYEKKIVISPKKPRGRMGPIKLSKIQI